MSQAPYMPVFTDALLGDTTHLTAEEFGSYCLILFATWNNGAVPFPDDDARLCLIVRCSLYKWRRLRTVLVKFFDIKDGKWRQKRLEKEWRRVSDMLVAQREKSVRGVAATKKLSEKMAIRSESFCEVASSKISTKVLKSLETGEPAGSPPKPIPKGEAKKEESRSKPSESVAAREGSKSEGGRRVAALPSAEPTLPPGLEAASPSADSPTPEPVGRAEHVAYVDAAVERAVAALRGGLPKGIRDAVAYQATIKANRFKSLIKAVNEWVGCGLDGEARMAAWEVLAAAEQAGARSGMAPAARRDLDRIIAMHRASSAGMEPAA